MCVIHLPKLLLLHSCTRKKSIIDKVSALGLSISYNRVDEIQSAITDQVCQKYQTKGLVRTTGWADSEFTTAGIDNVDLSDSFSTSKNYFHGTSISLFQHLDSPAANHQIVFDLSSEALGGQRNFKFPSYCTEITPDGAVKSHCLIKMINSGVTKLQAHPVQMCNKWLKFFGHVNCGSHKEIVITASNWADYHQDSLEQML